jgi:hypothetical protein
MERNSILLLRCRFIPLLKREISVFRSNITPRRAVPNVKEGKMSLGGGTTPLILNFDTRSNCCFFALCSVKCVTQTYLVEAWIPQMVESTYCRRAHIVTCSFVEVPLTKPVSLILRHVRSLLWLFTHNHASSAITVSHSKRALSGSGLRMRRVAQCEHSWSWRNLCHYCT